MTFCKYRCFSTLAFVIKTKKFNITIFYFFIKLFWLIKLTICAFQDQWLSIRDIYIYNPMFQRFDVFVYQRSAYFGSEYIYLFLKLLFGWLHVQPSKTYSRGCITIWWMCMGLCEGEGGMFQGNSVQIPCDVHTKSIKRQVLKRTYQNNNNTSHVSVVLESFLWYRKISILVDHNYKTKPQV